MKISTDIRKLKKTKIYVCTPGIGKTYMAQKSDKYIDIDRLRSNYKYGRNENFSIEEHENNKGKQERKIINNDYIDYAKKIINKYLKEDKILLLAPSYDLVDYINEIKEPYCLVYMSLKDNSHMKERLRKRGNQENFIEKNYNDEIAKFYYEENIKDERPTAKVELEKEEYLSDLMKKVNDKNGCGECGDYYLNCPDKAINKNK